MRQGGRPRNVPTAPRWASLTRAGLVDAPGPKCYLQNVKAHSSSGLGHRPLKAEIRGSNPLCATSSPDNSTNSDLSKEPAQLRGFKLPLVQCVLFLAGHAQPAG